jgi:hypothetical protein
MSSNPQLRTIEMAATVLIALLGPGLATVLTAYLACEPETLRAAAYHEFRFNDTLGLLGAGPVWNHANQILGANGYANEKVAYFWPLVGYRVELALLLLPAVLALTFAAWRAGQARGIAGFADGEEPSPHRADTWRYVLAWAGSLPAILSGLPWPIMSPITIPLSLLLFPIAAYGFGRHLPFRV